MRQLESQRGLLGRIALVALVLGGCWAINFAWWSLLPPPRTVELVIPAGTAGSVSAGNVVSAIPEELLLRTGDRLLILNEDSVVHEVGRAVAPPGRSTRVEVTAAFLGQEKRLVCSIHPSGAIGLSNAARPELLATLLPSLIAGVPLSIALLVAMAVAGRLDAGGAATRSRADVAS